MDNHEELHETNQNTIEKKNDNGLLNLAEQYGEIVVNAINTFASEKEDTKIKKKDE